MIFFSIIKILNEKKLYEMKEERFKCNTAKASNIIKVQNLHFSHNLPMAAKKGKIKLDTTHYIL